MMLVVFLVWKLLKGNILCITYFHILVWIFLPPQTQPLHLNVRRRKRLLFNFRTVKVQYLWLYCGRWPNWTVTQPPVPLCRRSPSGWTWNEHFFASKRNEKVQRLCWPWRSSNMGNVSMLQSALILTQVRMKCPFLLERKTWVFVKIRPGRLSGVAKTLMLPFLQTLKMW